MKSRLYLGFFTLVILLLFSLHLNAEEHRLYSLPHDSIEDYTMTLPVFFEKNIGQFNSQTKYYFHFNRTNVYFEDQSLTYQFIKPNNSFSDGNSISTINSESVQNIRITFPNSLPECLPIGVSSSQCKTNRFYGKESEHFNVDIPNFDFLYYNNLYKGIDLKFYPYKNAIKYDLILHSDGNLNEFSMNYEGINKLSIDSNGNLLIHTETGVLLEAIPEAYQLIDGEKKMVQISYIITASNTVKLGITSGYNNSYDLIIDPALIFSTFVGGSSDDQIYIGDMTKDDLGNIYTSGYTASSNYPTTPGAYDLASNGDYDVFVFKLNKSGTALLYSTYIGGSGLDQGTSIAVEKGTYKIFVAGTTESSNFPTSAGAFQTSFGGGSYDVFVLKLNGAGNGLDYSTYVGGATSDQGSRMKIDSLGFTYVTGQTGGGFDITAGSYQTAYGGGAWDAFAFKLNQTGTALVFSTYFGASGANRGGGLDIDKYLNVYLHGMTSNGLPTTVGAFQTTYGGGANDAFVAKLNSSGTGLLYSTYLGGPGDDFERASLVVDNIGQAYVTGLCGTGFPVTTGAYDVSHNGSSDVYVTKLNSSGTGLMFSTYLGSSGADIGFDITLNENKEVFVTGSCGTNFPYTLCAYDNSNNGSTDAFIVRLDSSGSQLLYSTFIGGTAADEGTSILAIKDTVYLIGNTSSSNFPVTVGSFDISYNGGANDVFALKLLTDQGLTNVDFDLPSSSCINQNVFFSNNSTAANTYAWTFGDGFSSTQIDPAHSYTSPGTYIVTLSGTGTCVSDSHNDTITIYGTPTYSISNDTVICSGDIIQISIVGTGTYEWSTGDSISVLNVVPSTDTQYFVTITENGCLSTDSIMVLVNPLPSVILDNDTTVCSSILLNAGSGFSSYLWQDGSLNATMLASSTGIYSVTVANNFGCTDADSIIVTVFQYLPQIDLGNDTTICLGTTFLLSPGSGYDSYLWQNGDTSQVLPVTVAGVYSVTVNSTGFCPSTDSIFIITMIPPLPFDLGNDTALCLGGSLTLTAPPGYDDYLWQNADTTQQIIVASSGTYSITATHQCQLTTDTIVIIINNPPSIYLGADTTICLGSSINLDLGSTFVSYLWQDGSTQQTLLVSDSGTYFAFVIDSNQCSASDSIEVSLLQGPQINLGPDGDICNIPSLTLNIGFIPGSPTFLWQDGSTNDSYLVTQSGTYSVVVTNSCGIANDSITFLACPNCIADLPSAFSPNGDGKNDIFRILGNGLTSVLFIIYNRHGEKVFETTEPLWGWDGYYKGVKQENEVYFYYLEAECVSGEKLVKKGDVTLMN